MKPAKPWESGAAEMAEISFEAGDSQKRVAEITISGVSKEFLTSEEKIKQLMDLLELPEGTNARVTVNASTVIVR